MSRQIIFISIVLGWYLFLLPLQTSANWYGNHAVSAPNPGAVGLTSQSGGGPNRGTWCTGDGDTTGGENIHYGEFAVAENNDSNTFIPHGNNEYSLSPGVDMRCLQWDAANPTMNDPVLSTISGDNIESGTWTNEDVTIDATGTCNDTGGSLCDTYSIQYKQSHNPFTCDASGTWHNGSSLSYTTPLGTNLVRYVCFRVQDNARNYGYSNVMTIRIDRIDPVIGFAFSGGTTYHNTWTNQDVTIVQQCSDLESGCIGIQSQVSSISEDACDPLGGNWTNTGSVSFTPPAGNLMRNVCFRVQDNASNGYIYTGATILIDKIVPDLDDDINNTNDLNLQADDDYIYNLSIDDAGGSPIDRVEGGVEHELYPLVTIPFSYNTGSISHEWNISDVDDARMTNGAREYTFRLTRICDDAGNCSTGTRSYDHNVYASTAEIDTNYNVINPLSTSIPADGETTDISFELKDVYGNAIIPATGISRTIDINVSGTNDLRLDQHDNTGNDSGIIIGGNDFPIGSGVSLSLDGVSSTGAIYPTSFEIFSPTSNMEPLVPGSASISSMTYDIIDDGTFGNTFGEFIGSSEAFDIVATPLYTTSIGGSIVDNGFIEGVGQSNTLSLSGSSLLPTSRSVLLEFGAPGNPNTENTNYNMRLGAGGTAISEPTNSPTSFISSFASGPHTLNTFLSQAPNAVAINTSSYLASLIQYRIDGRTVIYPSAIVGKDAYHGTVFGNNTTQNGILIQGTTYSQEKNNLTNPQETGNDIFTVEGNIQKSLLKKDIKRNVYNIIKNITPDNGSGVNPEVDDFNFSNDEDGIEIGDILYFGPDTSPIEISGGSVTGQKTVIAEGANIHITGNIFNNPAPPTSDMLGIIAIADEDGNGGNIYIDPEVTDIAAVLYAERTIASSDDGIVTLTGATIAASELANQLYIHGSVFSENTIGGSRAKQPLCPYFVPDGDCSVQEAQKYDLNYLRRYYEIDNGFGVMIPANGGNASKSTLSTNPVVIKYNPQIQLNAPPLFSE